MLEALRAGRVKELRVGERADGRLNNCSRWRTSVAYVSGACPLTCSTATHTRGVHQGVMAEVEKVADYSIEEIVSGASDAPLVVVLDGIEDPHNLGAILRTADAAGVDGVVIQSRRPRHAAVSRPRRRRAPLPTSRSQRSSI